MPSRWLGHFSWFALFSSSLLAVTVLVIAWQCQWSGPFRDYWEVMPFIEATFASPPNEWPWQQLWQPYGGAHRLVIPKLLFILDFHLTGGSNTLVLLTSMACLLGALALVIRRAYQCYPDHPAMRRMIASIALLTLFSGTQLFNLNYSYDTQWFQVTLFSMAALFFATHPDIHHRFWRYAMPALVAALFASLSNMAGFLVSPPVCLLLCMATPVMATRLFVIAYTVIVSTAFLYGTGDSATAPQVSTVLDVLGQLIGAVFLFLRYIPVYLGSPATQTAPVIAGLVAGLGLLWILGRGWRYRNTPQGPLLLLITGLAVQTTLVAMATAWGRRYYSIDMAMADRYQAIAMLFWMSLGIFLLVQLQHRQRWSWLPLPALCLAAVLLPYQYTAAQKQADLSTSVHSAHLAAVLGMTGMAIARNSISFPAARNEHNYMAWHDPFLKEHRMGYYLEPRNAVLTQPIAGTQTSPCTLQPAYRMMAEDHSSTQIWVTPDCPLPTGSVVLLIDTGHAVQGVLIPPQIPWLQNGEWTGYSRQAPETLTPVSADRGTYQILQWPGDMAP